MKPSAPQLYPERTAATHSYDLTQGAVSEQTLYEETTNYIHRAAWPRGSPCAGPQTLVKGQPGVILQIDVDFVARRRHLPHVTLSRAA